MFASSKWSKKKLNHAASVLAELLDQDEDGCADDQKVLKQLNLVDASQGIDKVVVLLPTKEDDAESGNEIMANAGYSVGQVLAENETKPKCSGLKFTAECSDASIEELFHLVTGRGHKDVYPKIFGASWSKKSTLSKAMDVARGGRYNGAPKKYPKSAWYTYDDNTCKYGCQAIEYIWWGYCAFSGTCKGRSGSSSFEKEWRYMTKSKLVEKDAKLAALFQNSGKKYKLPTKPVDGKYHGCNTCSSGTNHGGK